jgi:hypothetical protein
VYVREPFAHDVVLAMDAGADPAAPGAAITTRLCGHWEHEPPCPLAAHHTAAERLDDGSVRLRVLFAAEPADEAEVRAGIEAALSAWPVRTSGPSDVRPEERAHATRLVG